MNNSEALNKIFFILILFGIGLTSCVNRVAIIDEEKPMLVLDLQMLKGSDDIFATVHTSNNLNGTFPIEHPEDVVIELKDLSVQDNTIEFIYNPDRKVYEYSASEGVIVSDKTFNLTAEILGSDIPKINATSKVPRSSSLIDTELISSETYQDDEGQSFWQGKVRFNFSGGNTSESLYYQLFLNERLQIKSLLDDEVVYTTIAPGESAFEIVDVSSGQFAVKELVNTDGLWIDLDLLGDDQYFEIEIRSSFPIELDNQTSDNLFVNVLSITEEHYNYYLGLSNIESSSTTHFNEKGLYRSNINNGLGIFSTCVQNEKIINLTQ